MPTALGTGAAGFIDSNSRGALPSRGYDIGGTSRLFQRAGVASVSRDVADPVVSTDADYTETAIALEAVWRANTLTTGLLDYDLDVKFGAKSTRPLSTIGER